MAYTTYIKDPDAVLDYLNDWTDWLPDGDTIVTSTWTAETGITIDSDTNTTTAAVVWLSGGTAGTKYLVTNHIVTAQGREDDWSILINCKEK